MLDKIIVLLLIGTSVFASDQKYPEKYYKEIASPFQVSQGSEVFSSLIACKEIEKNKNFHKNYIGCLKKKSDKDLPNSVIRSTALWFLRLKDYKEVAACDIETITDRPAAFPNSFGDDSNKEYRGSFSLCLDFVEGNRPKRAVIMFKQRGGKLYYNGAKY
ncbi:hypothetical protein [Bacteriovorax sp. DB6_IX]|uniref:hypothetical protein n=1 Tax=Bacteriovorax sp. DB6_IX TaxID=1353530 RepID=UPI00038A3442|nr:hypothetical protein [Bacteriovorax sp. DB6_IX]EQC52106.1 hypothetical protein M901_0756 [Bacteriovorax sp. DB6_IX]